MILSDLYHVFDHAFCYVILLITSPGVLNALWFCYAMAPQDFACYSAMRFSLAILPYYSPSPLLSFAPTLIQLPFHLSPLSPLFQSCSPASPLPPSPLRPALSLLRLPDLLPAQTLIYIQQGHFYRKASLCAFLVNIYIYSVPILSFLRLVPDCKPLFPQSELLISRYWIVRYIWLFNVRMFI